MYLTRHGVPTEALLVEGSLSEVKVETEGLETLDPPTPPSSKTSDEQETIQ